MQDVIYERALTTVKSSLNKINKPSGRYSLGFLRKILPWWCWTAFLQSSQRHGLTELLRSPTDLCPSPPRINLHHNRPAIRYSEVLGIRISNFRYSDYSGASYLANICEIQGNDKEVIHQHWNSLAIVLLWHQNIITHSVIFPFCVAIIRRICKIFANYSENLAIA